ncbi:small VCP/p97-interacting protein [Vespa velutina]|uniref:small VCP/p97-interacting protein n=1 Tax=Vespa crabro TaxID=7445 RepID=UPI001F03080B|nr:small VCP/p97-interacting protein [Vespa crabro]XP_047355445.1 small VCP/p97-interacting protein [Vespa velutina]
MGILCASCCKESSSLEDTTPDLETRRRRQMEAAEKRIAEQEQRGIKDIESVKRKQKRIMELEKREEEAGNMSGQGKLKWQVN